MQAARGLAVVITIFAPAGIGEVVAGDDLARLVADAVAADPDGPLHPGDIVVVTSKIVSKAEGRRLPAADREDAIAREAVATVAWRGPMRIVRTALGLVQAAAGVDNSNVAPADILLLPEDPDASAAALRGQLSTAAGGPIGVIVSDTAGRAWRVGQTDHAIGAAGVVVARSYAGMTDSYGNPLQVTLMAVADELAAAADLVKGKLSQHPVAVIRGLTELVADSDSRAADLVRAARRGHVRARQPGGGGRGGADRRGPTRRVRGGRRPRRRGPCRGRTRALLAGRPRSRGAHPPRPRLTALGGSGRELDLRHSGSD